MQLKPGSQFENGRAYSCRLQTGYNENSKLRTNKIYPENDGYFRGHFPQFTVSKVTVYWQKVLFYFSIAVASGVLLTKYGTLMHYIEPNAHAEE